MYFMPFLDFRIVLRFEVDFNRHLAVAHNVRQGPASWNVVSATDHINVGIICYYGLRISSISKDFKQLLHSERTVSYWSVGYQYISTIWLFFYAAGVRSWCKILENFLFMFISHRSADLYYFHLKRNHRLEQNKTDIIKKKLQ